tara:strand:+ start:83 stop:451 length:369 start_codon:yes stop_codon:yes gene_type:complete
MSSLSVALPLRYSTTDGYQMNKTIKRLIKQNLKMLLLTNPGERVMEPAFGVGLNTYLFENFAENVYAEIDSRIKKQVKIYMPAILIRNIAFSNVDPDTHTLGVSIVYTIPNIGAQDLLEFTI